MTVLMNGYLYGNLTCFQLFPDLNEQAFQSKIQQLLNEEYLNFQEEGTAVIHSKGKAYLQAHHAQLEKETKWLNGYKYGRLDQEMWRLLQFSVQVISHLSYQNRWYSPIESSPYYQWKIKQVLARKRKEEIVSQVKTEWATVLDKMTSEESNFIAQQFSGYGWNGKTEQQLCSQFPIANNPFFRKNCYHHLFELIETNDSIDFLKELLQDALEKNNNQSMLQTKKMWLSGISPEEIGERRGMKQSTINDHLMELAIQEPDRAFDQIVDPNQISYLETVSGPIQGWQYAALKKEFSELDYFNFRMFQILTLHKEREN